LGSAGFGYGTRDQIRNHRTGRDYGKDDLRQLADAAYLRTVSSGYEPAQRP
jgi:hypothetical protein